MCQMLQSHFDLMATSKAPPQIINMLFYCPRKPVSAVPASVRQRKAFGLRPFRNGAVVVPFLYQFPAPGTRIQKRGAAFPAGLPRLCSSEVRLRMSILTNVDIKISHNCSSPQRKLPWPLLPGPTIRRPLCCHRRSLPRSARKTGCT